MIWLSLRAESHEMAKAKQSTNQHIQKTKWLYENYEHSSQHPEINTLAAKKSKIFSFA
jgi:hypothetical protein